MRKLDHGQKLPSNAMLVTMDIIGAYTNIPQEDGASCFKEAMDERNDQTVLSEIISKMMELILKHNLFEFHSAIWRQLFGTAMGSIQILIMQISILPENQYTNKITISELWSKSIIPISQIP